VGPVLYFVRAESAGSGLVVVLGRLDYYCDDYECCECSLEEGVGGLVVDSVEAGQRMEPPFPLTDTP